MVLKKRKGIKILLSFLLLMGIQFHSCTDEGIIGVSNWHQTFESGDDVLVRDAKTLINSMKGEITILDMAKTLGKAQTRTYGESPQALKNDGFSFEWEKSRSFKEDDGEVLIVPVKMKQNVSVWRFSLVNNKGKKEQTPMYSVLYVKKLNRSGVTVSRILSYAPARNHLRKFKAKTEIEWYDPTHTDYSGLLLVSSLNGFFSHAINFVKGHREYVVRPKRNHQDYVHTINTRAMVTDSTLSVPNKISPSNVVFFNMRTVTSNSSIRAYSYDDETYEQPGCIFCGGDPYTCDCFEIVVCEQCGYEPDNCICKCIICNEDPCVCEYCETCLNLKEDCTCTGNNNDEPPSGGGGGSGSTGNGENGEENEDEEEPTPEYPCYNPATGIFNPLMSMELAPPNSWNIAGTTFGYTRKTKEGDPKMHEGIDLYAEVGTPIYAMADGEVISIVTTQPNKIDGAYPPEYHGDRNGAGNRIKIKSVINGQIVYFSYWHLQASNPVGTDRNGNTLRKESYVYAGDIIGYTGITGNANENVPHLHLGVQNSDANWINPTTYLNATVSTTSTTITTPCD